MGVGCVGVLFAKTDKRSIRPVLSCTHSATGCARALSVLVQFEWRLEVRVHVFLTEYVLEASAKMWVLCKWFDKMLTQIKNSWLDTTSLVFLGVLLQSSMTSNLAVALVDRWGHPYVVTLVAVRLAACCFPQQENYRQGIFGSKHQSNDKGRPESTGIRCCKKSVEFCSWRLLLNCTVQINSCRSRRATSWTHSNQIKGFHWHLLVQKIS